MLFYGRVPECVCIYVCRRVPHPLFAISEEEGGYISQRDMAESGQVGAFPPLGQPTPAKTAIHPFFYRLCPASEVEAEAVAASVISSHPAWGARRGERTKCQYQNARIVIF